MIASLRRAFHALTRAVLDAGAGYACIRSETDGERFLILVVRDPELVAELGAIADRWSTESDTLRPSL